MTLTRKEIDALNLLNPVSMVVRPSFYARWARWLSRAMLESLEGGVLGPVSERTRDLMDRSLRVQMRTDDEIIENRLGDDFFYRGCRVHLGDFWFRGKRIGGPRPMNVHGWFESTY